MELMITAVYTSCRIKVIIFENPYWPLLLYILYHRDQLCENSYQDCIFVMLIRYEDPAVFKIDLINPVHRAVLFENLPLTTIAVHTYHYKVKVKVNFKG